MYLVCDHSDNAIVQTNETLNQHHEMNTLHSYWISDLSAQVFTSSIYDTSKSEAKTFFLLSWHHCFNK